MCVSHMWKAITLSFLKIFVVRIKCCVLALIKCSCELWHETILKKVTN